jgi:autotransporter-associated beta strand protein
MNNPATRHGGRETSLALACRSALTLACVAASAPVFATVQPNGTNGATGFAITQANQVLPVTILGGTGGAGGDVKAAATSDQPGNGGFGGVGLESNGNFSVDVDVPEGTSVTGGAGGRAGSFVGIVQGSINAARGGEGGYGARISAPEASFVNQGVLQGGEGGANASVVNFGDGMVNGFRAARTGGIGLLLDSLTGKNYNQIRGGTGGAGALVVLDENAVASYAPGAIEAQMTGGQGGRGVYLASSTYSFENGGLVRGGNGGNGVANPVDGNTRVVVKYGSGGSGGKGVESGWFGVTLLNRGTIEGGDGGAGGEYQGVSGPSGAGGVGVGVGDPGADDITLINAGTISGGLSGDGLVRANAVELTGGTVELRKGYVFNGNVVGRGGSNTLKLGGDIAEGDGAFNASLLGSQFLGFSTLVKEGTSTWTVSGASAVSLPTAINAGTLIVGDSAHPDASLQGDVTVAAAGTLRGHGTLRGNVSNQGTVWPGASIGTLHVQGDYTQSPTGRLIIDLAPTETSQLAVSGVATLDGALELRVAPGTYTSGAHPIVQAGSVVGTFASTTGLDAADLSALQPTLTYSPTAAAVTLTASTPETPGTPGTPETPGTPGTPGIPGTTAGVVRVAPDDAGLYTNLASAVLLNTHQSAMAVLNTPLAGGCNPSADRSVQCGTDVWVRTTGQSLDLQGSHGASAKTFGLQVGLERSLAGDAFHLGGVLSGDQVNVNDHEGGTARSRGTRIGLYAYGDLGPLRWSGLLDAGRANGYVSRLTELGKSTASPDVTQQTAGVQLAWPVTAAAWTVTPQVGALYQRLHLQSVNESVASQDPFAPAFAVHARRQSVGGWQPYAGVELSRAFVTDTGTVTPSLAVGYRRGLSAKDADVSVATTDGTVFNSPGANVGKGQTAVRAQVSATLGPVWRMQIGYQGLFATHLRQHAVQMSLARSF